MTVNGPLSHASPSKLPVTLPFTVMAFGLTLPVIDPLHPGGVTTSELKGTLKLLPWPSLEAMLLPGSNASGGHA